MRTVERRRATQEALDVVREYYPVMAGRVLDRRMGWPQGTTAYLRRAFLPDVEHTDETLRRIKDDNVRRMREAHSHVDHKAIGRKLRRKRIAETARVLGGQPQQTRMKLSLVPKRTHYAKGNLVSKYGYLRCDGEPYTLLYDGMTQRRQGMRYDEDYYTYKYHIKFKSYED